MPHSSGGGSHSGGFHSSGHYSGRTGPRISSRPFLSAHRYLYMDRYGREKSVYSSVMPKKQSLVSLIMQLAIITPFIVVSSCMIFKAYLDFGPPKPMKERSTFGSIHITDDAGVLDDTGELENTLKEFQKETGICPYILTVKDSEWDQDYNDLESFAYDKYLQLFDDEQHYLVVYSDPVINEFNYNFADWSWEGMQGNDTDRILTVGNMNKFGNDVQKYLTKDDVSVTDAFNTAFKNSLNYMMTGKNYGDSPKYMIGAFAVFWFAIMFWMYFKIIRSYKISSRDYREVPMDYQSKEDIYTGPEIK